LSQRFGLALAPQAFKSLRFGGRHSDFLSSLLCTVILLGLGITSKRRPLARKAIHQMAV
jgi:hypothetical protein